MEQAGDAELHTFELSNTQKGGRQVPNLRASGCELNLRAD